MTRMTLVSIGLVLSLSACASIPVTQVTIQSFELQKKGITPPAAVNQLVGVLVDRGFDVKMSSPDSGIVTTEYKKFASAGDDPPFDYYMQIRSRIKTTNGVTAIILTPMVREQNRANTAAFSEHELAYFTGDSENLRDIASMRPSVGWRALGQVFFMNVVRGAADVFGIAEDDVIQNVTRTPRNARDYED